MVHVNITPTRKGLFVVIYRTPLWLEAAINSMLRWERKSGGHEIHVTEHQHRRAAAAYADVKIPVVVIRSGSLIGRGRQEGSLKKHNVKGTASKSTES